MIPKSTKSSGFNLVIYLVISGFIFTSCLTKENTTSAIVKIYPDSVIRDVSNFPVGINLDFFMDGGRFPRAEKTTAEALKEMGVRYLRYPGGEKSDLYLFSIPPYEKSQPSLARTGYLGDYPGMITDEGTFTYDPLDFDEFIDICHFMNAEPVLTVAADNYLHEVKKGEKYSSREDLIRNAAEWVRYANIGKKYGVKYWMIGNESWNSNNENSTVDIYAQDVIDFSKAMKAVDSAILIIPNGDSEDFFKTVLTKTGNHIDRICVSNYGIWDFVRGYKTYRDTSKCLIRPALIALNAMNKYASDEQKKKLKLIVSEFGTIDWLGHWKGTNDIGHAIVAFDMAGQLLNQPRIEFLCYWNTRWIENQEKPGVDHDAIDMNGNINPTGFSLLLWNRYLGKQLIKTHTDSNPIVYSTYSPDENKIFVYLINKTETPVSVKIDIENIRSASITKSFEYFGLTPDDMHPVWQPKEPGKHENSIDLKRLSITVLEMKIKKK
jgi:alpha-L-arabinofuranosidase